MCKNKNEGCRCAADTRPAFAAHLAAADAGPMPMSALAELVTAATAHASTPSGQTEVRAAAEQRSGTIAMLLSDAASKGAAALAARQAARNSTAAMTAGTSPTTITPATMRRRAPIETTPGGWTMSAHLLRQAHDKGISTDDLIACIDHPDTAYESRRYPGQRKHLRAGICVAVDPSTRSAITVFVDRVETDLRADQLADVDAVRWNAARANRSRS